MKNAYALHLARKKVEREMELNKEGVQFGLDLCVVALNNLYGFGNKRITALEKEINRLLEEEFGKDLEAAAYGMAKRIKQIRGER